MNNNDFIIYEGKMIEIETFFPRMKLKGIVKKYKNNYYVDVDEEGFKAKIPVKYVFKINKVYGGDINDRRI
jgi:hypothetical protein